MRRRRLGVLVIPLALAAVRASTQVDPGFEPVPAANLSEGTLSVPEENFTMHAPGPQWEWLRDSPREDTADRKYLCRNLRTGERFLLTVVRRTDGNAEKYAADWLDRIKASQEPQGRELVGPRSDPSDVPAAGSYRLSTMITGRGATIYFMGYVLGAGQIYAFQHYSDTATESPAFSAFARSFALRDPAASAAWSLFGRVGVAAVATALAVLLLGAWIFGRGSKGKRASR